MRVDGSVAIITGGASGLGKATARSLIEKGGKVALFDLDPEAGRSAEKELGESAKFFQVNVVDHTDVDQRVEEVREYFGLIQFAINCAGIGGSQKVLGKEGLVPQEWFTNIVNVNLVGTFNVIRATLPIFKENQPSLDGEKGVYINTASVAAQDGQVGQCAYAASKGGIVSMTLPLAREFADDGIRIMTILPGLFETPLLAKLNEKAKARLSKQVPFPERLGRPEEFAGLALHLIDNPYLNGECIRLDGSLRMGYGRK